MSAKSTKNSGPQPRTLSYLGWVLFLLTLPALVWALSDRAKSKEILERDTCIVNLRQIDDAKEKWALEYKKRSGEKVEEESLAPHAKTPPAQLHCPSGGRYTINAIGTNPQCSIAGHTLD